MGIGLLAALLFSTTFVVNRSMQLGGGAWEWTLATLPFWIVLATVGLVRTGAPGGDEVAQSAVVAVIGGVLATTLFFAATASARHDPTRLAAVEATQSGEVVFAAALEVLIVGGIACCALGDRALSRRAR
jgi:hypothetical protein